VDKIKEENILEDIKTIACMEKDLKELRDLDSKIAWNFTSKVCSTILIFLISAILMSLPELLLNVIFNLFAGFFESYLWASIRIIGIFSITGMMILLLNQEERKLVSAFSDKMNILNSAYQLNIEVDENAVVNFNQQGIQRKIKEFSSDLEKVDFVLMQLRDENDEFMNYSDLILRMTEGVTKERKRRQKVRLEASRRLGDSEEKREEILRIVE
jgi:hypothetical protein